MRAHVLEVQYPTLAYLDAGKVSSCGGRSSLTSTEACYDYHIVNNQWTGVHNLSEAREWPSSSLVGGDGDWLISGGAYSLGSATTEVREVGGLGLTTPGPMLPEGMAYGCQVTLNQTHVFFADGHDKWATILDYERGTFHQQVVLRYNNTY